jgi:hypothetical protein
MNKIKDRHHISEDELTHRMFLQHEWRVAPSRKAVQILHDRICEVLKKLGVDTTKDDESIQFQMQTMDIYINSISEEDLPKAGGFYISAFLGGELVPYAYISSAKVKHGEYMFPIVYWTNELLDEGKLVKI